MTENDQLLRMYGDTALAPPICETLSAGKLSLVYTEEGDIRSIKYGSVELIRRIYVAVRASDWWTVPVAITMREKTITGDSFRIVYEALYCAPARGIDFRATVTITGKSDGSINFDFKGQSFSEFERNRIGICVLHPADAKGTPVIITHTNGTVETGTLPDTISPHQPFFDISAIHNTVAPGIEANIAFTGDTFEMEDQRNWLDASFKTYSTPLELPMPVRIVPGDNVHQSVTVTLQVTEKAAPESLSPTLSIDTAKDQLTSLPSIGVVLIPEVLTLLLEARKTNKPLDIQHIFVSVDFSSGQWQSYLSDIDQAAASLNLALFVFLPEQQHYPEEFPQFQSSVTFFVDKSLTKNTLEQIKKATHNAPIVPGTLSDFTDLNRNRPDPTLGDGVFFAGTPQVHAFDSLSIAETPPMIAEAIRTAQMFAAGKPIHVGPLTFTGPYSATDARETAEFGKAWYQQILDQAIEAGAASVTLSSHALVTLQERKNKP